MIESLGRFFEKFNSRVQGKERKAPNKGNSPSPYGIPRKENIETEEKTLGSHSWQDLHSFLQIQI